MKKTMTRLTALGLVAVMIFLAVYCDILSKQNRKLRATLEKAIVSEWVRLYQMTYSVETYVIPESTRAADFKFYIMRACQDTYTLGGNGEAASSLRTWLAVHYSRIYEALASVPSGAKHTTALDLIQRMNTDLMEISRSVIDMEPRDVLALLDAKSPQYIELLDRIQTAERKYGEETEDFVRTFPFN